MSKIIVEASKEFLQEIPLRDQAMMRQIFELGLTQLKIEIALRRYREGRISLGYATRLAGIPKREMILQARARGVAPQMSEQTVREELGAAVATTRKNRRSATNASGDLRLVYRRV